MTVNLVISHTPENKENNYKPCNCQIVDYKYRIWTKQNKPKKTTTPSLLVLQVLPLRYLVGYQHDRIINLLPDLDGVWCLMTFDWKHNF